MLYQQCTDETPVYNEEGQADCGIALHKERQTTRMVAILQTRSKEIKNRKKSVLNE